MTTAFTGTAAYYARYRPPYPEQFLADLRSRANTTGHGMLLDVACGPGRVAIPMAPYFDSVLAIDVEAEMIAFAEQDAVSRGAPRIDWRVTRAEDLHLPAGSVELITIGEAFHRLDRHHVLQCAVRWLRPGGSLATLAAESPWRGHEAWQTALVRVVNEWTAQSLGDPNTVDWRGRVDGMRGAGFTVQEHESVIDHTWTCDSIVGFMFSTSIASRRALGESADPFESELRAALLAVEPGGRFPCRQRFGFTLGTK